MTETIGTARLDVVVNTAGMEAGVATAKRQIAGLSADAQKQFAGLDARTKNLALNSVNLANSFGKSRLELKALNVEQRIGGSLGRELAASLRAAAAAQGQVGAGALAATKAFAGTSKTAREMQFAMRGLPAQLTDIFTSMASGQKPMLVLLQQGGQLKDMFGGIRPAAAALGGALKGLINPITLLAGALGGLAFMWNKADSEMASFNRALILTGNSTGLTAEQLKSLAAGLDEFGGVSRGSAAEALTKVAESGKFTAEQLTLVSRAAAQMREVTGREIDETVAEFAKLAKEPVDAALELNDKYHFLTQSQIDRIRVLRDEGKEQEAATEAIRAYSDAVNERIPRVVENLGFLEGVWHNIKAASVDSGNWAVQSLSRIGDKAKEVASSPYFRMLAGLRGDLNLLVPPQFSGVQGGSSTVPAVDSGAERAAQKEREEHQKRLAEWYEDRLQFASETERRETEILRVIAEGRELGLSPEEIRTRVDAMRAFWSEQVRSTKQTREQTTETNRLVDTFLKKIESQERSIALYGNERRAAAAAYDVEAAGLREVNPLLATKHIALAGILDLQDQVSESLQSSIDALHQDFSAQMQEMAGDTEQATSQMSVFAQRAGENMQDAFAEFLFRPFDDGLDGMLKSFGEMLEKMAAQALASQIFSAIGNYAGSKEGGFWSFISSMFPTKNANGNVYSSKSLSAYSGGVYNTPQLFAFANGAGVFGEAGPEAIMPLKRGPSGKLGVEANGGGVSVELNVYGGDGKAEMKQRDGADGRKIIDLVVGEVDRRIMGGKSTSKAISQRFGLSHAGTARG